MSFCAICRIAQKSEKCNPFLTADFEGDCNPPQERRQAASAFSTSYMGYQVASPAICCPLFKGLAVIILVILT
jgi:hypothetical protein